MGNLHTNALANVEDSDRRVYDIKPDVAKHRRKIRCTRIFEPEELAHSAGIDGVLVFPDTVHPKASTPLFTRKRRYSARNALPEQGKRQKTAQRGEAGANRLRWFVRRYMAKTHELKKRFGPAISNAAFLQHRSALGMSSACRVTGSRFEAAAASSSTMAHHMIWAMVLRKPVRVYPRSTA